MKYTPLSPQFHAENRRELANKLKPNSIVIIHSNDLCPKNGDQHYPFRQNSNLLYLCGIDQEASILCILPYHNNNTHREILFIKETNGKIHIWEGQKLSKGEAQNISGIKEIYGHSEFNDFLENTIPEIDSLYLQDYTEPKNYFTPLGLSDRFFQYISAHYPEKKILPISMLIHESRIIKKKEEIDQIKKACSITEKAFKQICQIIKPGIYENEIEAEIAGVLIRNGAKNAFDPIIASGKNACILHYTENNQTCMDGDLVLIDFGAEYGNYASDLSRTLPINGKFTDRQKQCYQAVLDVFKKAKSIMVPGNTIENIHRLTTQWMESEMIELGLLSQNDFNNENNHPPLYLKFYMHGTAHFMGIDVHDVGTKQTRLEKGMIITCEPGIYIPSENLGIRIETDILIDEKPIDLMPNIPLEIDDIETLINSNKQE